MFTLLSHPPRSLKARSIHERPSPDHSRSAVSGHASYSSRASGDVTFSDSCLCIASHFAFAYRVAYLVRNRDTGRSPGVTHESSVSCRQQTPWCDSDAFAPILRARPNPIFGRPVHQGSPPFDYSPILLLKPFGFRITSDTLSSSE